MIEILIKLIEEENYTIIGAGLLGLFVIFSLIAFVILMDDKPASSRLQKSARSSERDKFRSGWLSLLEKDKNTPEARRRALEKSMKKPGFEQQLRQADIKMRPISFIIIFFITGASVGIGLWYLELPIYGYLAPALVIALLGPRVVVGKLVHRRREKFLANFANAIDTLVRGVRAGLPVSEGLKIISQESPDPVGSEFARFVAATSVGFSLDEGATQLANRIPSTDVNFFRTVLVIQKQTGGNLGDALTKLSEIIRERQKLRKKVWALSSEARMSAIIIGCLPLFIGGMIYGLKPDYIMLLFNDDFGQTLVMGAGGWMFLGIMVMRAMINFDV